MAQAEEGAELNPVAGVPPDRTVAPEEAEVLLLCHLHLAPDTVPGIDREQMKNWLQLSENQQEGGWLHLMREAEAEAEAQVLALFLLVLLTVEVAQEVLLLLFKQKSSVNSRRS